MGLKPTAISRLSYFALEIGSGGKCTPLRQCEALILAGKKKKFWVALFVQLVFSSGVGSFVAIYL